jgi:hypothetical protein
MVASKTLSRGKSVAGNLMLAKSPRGLKPVAPVIRSANENSHSLVVEQMAVLWMQ